MIPEEEGLAREVEVEEEAKRMYIGVTNVTSWVTNILNVLKMRTLLGMCYIL